jgi:hypothetical protein
VISQAEQGEPKYSSIYYYYFLNIKYNAK